jgi:D-alanyl-D-alanine carboxypeptidase (penicillin-binding protein 5/6)
MPARLVPLLLAALIAGLLGAPAARAQKAPPKPDISAQAAIVIDAATGDVAYAKAPDQRRAIASTTKLMTALLALEAGDLEAVVPAVRYRALPSESRMSPPLQPGEKLTEADLLRGLLIVSANDAAVTIAQHVAGSVPSFVRRMNRRAQQLGLENTHYANPIGLDDPGNYSSARDLARLTLKLRKHKFFRRTVRTQRTTLASGNRPRSLTNRNTLLGAADWIDGVKTGFTSQAGDVLVASGRRRGVRLISVVLGTPSAPARNADSLTLLRYGFSRYKRLRAVVRGDVVARVPIKYRAGAELPLMASTTVHRTMREGERFGYREEVPASVDGPVSYGDRIGSLVILVRGKEVRRVPLEAGLNVPAAGTARRTQDFVTGPWSLAVLGGVLLLLLAAGARARRPPPRPREEPPERVREEAGV